MPLGLIYLASWLRALTDSYEIKILDARIKGMSLDGVRKRLGEFLPDFVGISSMHADSKEAHKIAALSKQVNGNCKVIIGGPYASADTQAVLADHNVDFCIKGEGEEAFGELMLAFESGAGFSQIKGLGFRKNGQVFYSGDRQPIADLDRLPFAAWDLLDIEDYFNGRKRSLENPMQIYSRGVSLISSRGCPFQCIYCHDIFGKRFRPRSPENVLEEVKLLVSRYGVREIEFLDDTFNFDIPRAKRIADLLREADLKLKICFSNGIRADFVDEELLDKLKIAGAYRINYGIESVSPRIQKIMKKNLDPGSAERAIEATVKRGMLCGGFFMLGFPSETEKEMMETVEYARRSKLHTAVFAIVTPYPGTEMYRAAKQSLAALSFSTVGRASLNLSAVSNERLEAIKRIAYRRFYLSLSRFVHIYKAAGRKLALLKNFLEVLKVCFLRKELFWDEHAGS